MKPDEQFPGVMVNFMCQLDLAKRCPGHSYALFLDASVRMLLEEICT